MAERTVLVDDLTGEEGASRLSFAVDGLQYEVDLSDANRASFLGFVQRYIDVARPVGKHPRKPTARASTDSDELARIRKWALDHGYTVAAKGKIPKDVVADWEADQAAQRLVPGPTDASGSRSMTSES